jgi:decaprenyl-phosphate phosphoribosyltransferase
MVMIRNMLKVLRPKQWTKNLLVAVAPIASGLTPSEVKGVGIGIIGFVFASSLGYIINDWRDRELDAIHEQKRSRPFASGELNSGHLYVLIIICLIGMVLSSLTLPLNYAISILTYTLITVTYSLGIKNLPVLEMIWLASGFLVRAISGSTIIAEPPTGWFLVLVLFGALFIVSAKRYAELKTNPLNNTRNVLKSYTLSYLQSVNTLSISITLMTYSLWVFEVHANSFIAKLTILPFSLCILRYAHQSELKNSESPELLILGDRVILLSGFTTVVGLMSVFYL